MKKRPGCAASLSDKESDGTRQKFPVLSLTNTPRPRASDPYSSMHIHILSDSRAVYFGGINN